MVTPGPKTPDNPEQLPADWDPIPDDLYSDEGLNIEDFSDDGTEPVSELADVEDLSVEETDTHLSWDMEPLEEPDSEDSLLLDVPEDPELSFAEESAMDEGAVVLPWSTTGRWSHLDTDVPVQLDPSQPHSTWYSTNPDIQQTGFTVQGVDILVSFTKIVAETELVVLGRDALDGRILISSSRNTPS